MTAKKDEEYIVSYAQNREDVLLAAFFFGQKDGFYVDVGANDPEADSVTKYFYDRGWHGINIEPSPRLHGAVERARKRDVNLNVGVSDTKGTLSFREYAGHGLSTFSSATKAEHEAGDNPFVVDYQDYDVPVRRLDDILAEQKVGTIDFMKIDVEGYEYEVIVSNDWKKFRPRVLCIEANHVHNDWRKVLKDVNYTKVFFDGLNEYYIDSERPAPDFQYVKAVIGRPIINTFAYELIHTVQEDRDRLHEDLMRAWNDLREAELEQERTNAYLIERTRIVNLAKDLARKINTVILIRLNNHLKRKKSYPVIASAQVDQAQTAEALLGVVSAADRQAFVMAPPLSNQIEIAVFGAIRAVYVAIVWTLAKVAKLSLRILRKMIRIVRHG
jgi:FkbM family methyltransferase